VSLRVLVLTLVAVIPSSVPQNADNTNHLSDCECPNGTQNSAWNCIEQLLQFGVMTGRDVALNWTENYPHCLHAMTTGTTVPQPSSFQSKERNLETRCTEIGLGIIREIYELAKINIHIMQLGKRERSLTEQEKGWEIFECLNELIFLLKDSIAELELALQKVQYIHSLTQSCVGATSNGSWICVLQKHIDKKRDKLKHYEHKCEHFNIEQLFGRYVNPVIFSLIFIVGLAGNGSVLLIFATENKLRTKGNVMIFNLVVGDTLNLLINLPLHYVVHYSYVLRPLSGLSCHLLALSRFLFFAVSALSVVSLSVQRYCITLHTLGRPHTSTILVLYVSTVWLSAILVSLPETVNVTEQKGLCVQQSAGTGHVVLMLRFLFYCVTCPCVMVAFSVVTARRLRRSTRDVPSQLCNTTVERSRNRSAKVLRILALVFLLTYVPSFTWNFVSCRFEDAIRVLPDIVTASIDHVSYHLSFLNVCCNPVALYTASSAFRKPLSRYLCRCCYKLNRKPSCCGQWK
jgi:hypothetical protein